MDIHSYMKHDHAMVKDLINQVCISRTPQERKSLYKTAKAVLLDHIHSEEMFFPELSPAVDAHIICRLQEDRDRIQTYMQDLDNMDTHDKWWIMLFSDLKYAVERHIRTQETQLLPAVAMAEENINDNAPFLQHTKAA